jgi:hypothetical protein
MVNLTRERVQELRDSLALVPDEDADQCHRDHTAALAGWLREWDAHEPQEHTKSPRTLSCGECGEVVSIGGKPLLCPTRRRLAGGENAQ